MKYMGALSPNKRTIISWNFAIRATAIKLHSTDTAILIVCCPMPRCNCCPFLYLYFHLRLTCFFCQTDARIQFLPWCTGWPNFENEIRFNKTVTSTPMHAKEQWRATLTNGNLPCAKENVPQTDTILVDGFWSRLRSYMPVLNDLGILTDFSFRRKNKIFLVDSVCNKD